MNIKLNFYKEKKVLDNCKAISYIQLDHNIVDCYRFINKYF